MPYKTSAIIIAAFAGHAAADGHADGHADDLVDLFPHKVTVSHAKFFSVFYNSTFKELHITDGDAGSKTGRYLLQMPDHPLPAELDVSSYDAVIDIPLTSVAFTQTSSLPFFELLGVRSTMHKITLPASSLSSPCLHEMAEDGSFHVGDWSEHTIDETDFNVDVTFGSKYSDQTNLMDDDSAFLPFDEWNEPSILGQEEYLKLASIFYNEEEAANEIFGQIEARLDCVGHNTEEYLKFHDEITEKAILWAYYSTYPGYEGWSVGQCKACPTCMTGQGPYYCEAAGITGATIAPITDSFPGWNGWANLNHTQFAKYAKDADVFFYPDVNYGDIIDDPEFAYLKTFKSIIDSQVYDIQGLGSNDYHEGRAAELDVFVEDMAAAVFSTGGVAKELMNFEHELVWFRHVETVEIGEREKCMDVDAPLAPQANQCTKKSWGEIFDAGGAAAGVRVGVAAAVAVAAAAVLLM